MQCGAYLKIPKIGLDLQVQLLILPTVSHWPCNLLACLLSLSLSLSLSLALLILSLSDLPSLSLSLSLSLTYSYVHTHPPFLLKLPSFQFHQAEQRAMQLAIYTGTCTCTCTCTCYMLHSPSYIIELASNQRPANWVLMYTVNSFKCPPVATRGPTGMLISSHSPDSLSTRLIEWQLSFEWGPSA